MRALIAPQDLERFDGQVVYHEMEAWRARHGSLGLVHTKSLHSSHPESHVPTACQLTASAMGYAKASVCVCVPICSPLCVRENPLDSFALFSDWFAFEHVKGAMLLMLLML